MRKATPERLKSIETYHVRCYWSLAREVGKTVHHLGGLILIHFWYTAPNSASCPEPASMWAQHSFGASNLAGGKVVRL